MDAGDVQTLLVLDANPAYDAPVDLPFGQALTKVKQRIHLGLYRDETAQLCDWHLPMAHALESWSDLRAWDGTASIVQPLIEPLYAGRSAHQVLAPLFLVAAVTSAVTFGFNERIVTRSTATLKAWQNVEYGPIPQESAIKSNVWLQDGPNILFARSVAGEGKSMRMDGVSWYRRDEQGRGHLAGDVDRPSPRCCGDARGIGLAHQPDRGGDLGRDHQDAEREQCLVQIPSPFVSASGASVAARPRSGKGS